jgi:site-specific DNA recombinase
MTPTHTRRESRQYRYYVSRLGPGEDRNTAWRVPAGEIERTVIGGVVAWLRDNTGTALASANDIVADVNRRAALATGLVTAGVVDQRAALLDLGLHVQLREEAIILLFGKTGCSEVEIPARLVRHGSDVRLALPPGDETGADPDPVLLRLVAHARAAQLMVESGVPHPSVAHYGKRHFWQLLRIAWLAPDVHSAIVEGRQPPQLTGRTLLRATNIPLDWAGQRRLFGFQ